MTAPRKPDDYVLIDGDKVYDVRCIGGGPHFWMMVYEERVPAPVPPPWWRYWLRVMFASARWSAAVWLVHKLATLYFEAMRPS